MIKNYISLHRKKSKGFTLIEMVVVIIILGILVTLAVPKVSAYLDHGKMTKAVSDASQLAAALNMYNTTVKTPINGSDLSDPTLEQKLTDVKLLPKLSADFDKAITNVTYDTSTQLFDAKTQADINLNGY